MTKVRLEMISKNVLQPMLTKQRHKFKPSVRHVTREYLKNLWATNLCYLSVFNCVRQLCDTCYFSGLLSIDDLADLHNFFSKAYYSNVDSETLEEYDNAIFH